MHLSHPSMLFRTLQPRNQRWGLQTFKALYGLRVKFGLKGDPSGCPCPAKGATGLRRTGTANVSHEQVSHWQPRGGWVLWV